MFTILHERVAASFDVRVYVTLGLVLQELVQQRGDARGHYVELVAAGLLLCLLRHTRPSPMLHQHIG